MNIRSKLLCAFGFVLALLVITAGVSLYSMNVMRQQTDYYGSKLLPGSALVKDVHRGIYQYHLAVSSEVLGAEGANIQALGERMERQLKGVERVATNDRVRDFVDELRTSWAGYLQLSARARQLAAEGERDEAVRLIAHEGGATLQALEEMMTRVDAYLGESTARVSESVSASQRSNIFIAIGLLVVAVLATLILSFKVSRSLADRAARLRQAFARVAEGDLSVEVEVSGKDELADLANDFNIVCRELRSAFTDIGRSMNELRGTADAVAEVFQRTASRAQVQQDEMDAVATAMNEMAMTIGEVASSAENAAASAREADEQAVSGGRLIGETRTAVQTLSERVREVARGIEGVNQSSQEIDTVLEVIGTVAEQTNLLALNAAIEAARAGEQGRGFAVVADEVRTLARRTQESTLKIVEVIERLRESATAAVAIAEAAVEESAATTQSTENTAKSLIAIVDAVANISDRNASIATSAEEQSHVAQEMDRNIVRISDASRETLADANEASTMSIGLKTLADDVAASIGRYRV